MQRLIGAHVSAAGGIDKAIERAQAIGCNCVQVFSGSPRVWARSPLDKIDTQKVFAKQAELLVTPIVTHSIYLLNLASENPDLVRKSTEALTYDLHFDSLVKGGGVVVHLGSHQGRGWEPVKDQVVEKLSFILAQTPDNSTLLIENSAGQQGKLTSDLQEIRWLLDQVKSPRLGWCLDTCHAHANGYALGSVMKTRALTGETKVTPKDFDLAETITQLDLWSALKVIHVNDSRDEFASGRDRHANLNDGLIPTEDLRHFLNLPQLAHVPLILEVPGLKDEGPDAENVQRLKALVTA
jgi:deoxyribonuclease-4